MQRIRDPRILLKTRALQAAAGSEKPLPASLTKTMIESGTSCLLHREAYSEMHEQWTSRRASKNDEGRRDPRRCKVHNDGRLFVYSAGDWCRPADNGSGWCSCLPQTVSWLVTRLLTVGDGKDPSRAIPSNVGREYLRGLLFRIGIWLESSGQLDRIPNDRDPQTNLKQHSLLRYRNSNIRHDTRDRLEL
ncbi:hypothetical protein EJ03DRAFT_35764 [Teratosphaeria nubilosa]|uniref:Uncharacterized protein n=1 Tax=Teratosphaeria nubilosa TaxID=161662 RepID=A0A6G1KU72_9PEZI|nr:hypothetical protein EJ03DRAFT_35764 [Teratosphaeria nubilosa]